jgi:thiamine kinase-like enzyme
VISWEHAGAIPPAWDLGSTTAFWSEGVLDQVNAVAARAVVAGYADEAEIPGPLDLGMFSATVCGSLSWLASRIRIAVTEADAERRGQADRAVPWLLDRLPSRARFEAVLDALA